MYELFIVETEVDEVVIDNSSMTREEVLEWLFEFDISNIIADPGDNICLGRPKYEDIPSDFIVELFNVIGWHLTIDQNMLKFKENRDYVKRLYLEDYKLGSHFIDTWCDKGDNSNLCDFSGNELYKGYLIFRCE